MKASELVSMAITIAKNFVTCYMLGPWGWPATDTMIIRATTNGSNAETNKQWLSKANTIKNRGFIFDCVGLIKGILWGWSGDMSRPYGGAGYACNGVPDYGADTMISKCIEVSTDFSNIVPGEAVWMSGHIGIYIGDGLVVEATPKWNCGVQISTCSNVSSRQLAGTVGSRKWTKHGKLPWVDYTEKENDIVATDTNKPSVWAAEAWEKICNAGVMDGKSPQGTVTREMLATVLDRLGLLQNE